MGSERFAPDPEWIRGGLRQLVVRLDMAQLLVVLGWIDRQLVLQRTRPSLRGPVCVPDDDDALEFRGDVIEAIGYVRRYISALPPHHLLVLHSWVRRELDDRLTHE